MMEDVSGELASERNRRWAATMEGYEGGGDVTVAHQDSVASIEPAPHARDISGDLGRRELAAIHFELRRLRQQRPRPRPRQNVVSESGKKEQ
jgi:hypothetical protein